MLRKLIQQLKSLRGGSLQKERRGEFRSALARQTRLEFLESRWMLSADPQLLGDIGVSSAAVELITVAGGTTFFSASRDNKGIELWKTDGTPGGTVLVKDINPGFESSQPSNFTTVGSTLFFTAVDETHGRELWKSDGTTAGTVMVKDIRSGSSSFPNELTSFNGKLFFEANDGISGRELWESDGTSGGTVMVKDINPNNANSNPFRFFVVEDKLFFIATAPTSERELWVSDGTSAGTMLVKDIAPPGRNSNPSFFANVHGTLFFRANDGSVGDELWKSDGTDVGTTLVKDINPGSLGSAPAALANLGGTLFFQANDGDRGFELWTSDGTPAGTTLFKEINPTTDGSDPSRLTTIGSEIYFQADDGTTGPEVWKTDGTVGGTVLVKEINPSSEGSYPYGFTEFNGEIFFEAYDGSSGFEFWKTDGTTAGTVLVKDLEPGANSSYPGPFLEIGGTLYFSAIGEGRAGLFTSDGTSGGTQAIARFDSEEMSFPTRFTESGGSTFFRAADGSAGYELWKTDGTPGGTVLVKDIRPGLSNGSYPGSLTDLNGTLLFSAIDDVVGTELWKSDGTAGGTVLLKDINPTGDGVPAYLTKTDAGTVFFSANDGVNGYELWKTDGTTGGTMLVKDINSGSDGSYPFGLTNLNGTVFFGANDGDSGYELWKSDGTEAGTVLVKDINPGGGDSTPYALTELNGELLFNADDGSNGYELWKTDGTTLGTVLVKDVNPNGSSEPYHLTRFNNEIFFKAYDDSYGEELWKTDGTTSGTVLVKDINTGPDSSAPYGLTSIGSLLMFEAYDAGGGSSLWATDGSTAGTVLVKDIDTSSTTNGPSYLVTAKGLLFFSANDGIHGEELWQSDGTTAGTVLVRDVVPGETGFFPSYLTVSNGHVYFNGNDQITGTEPWVLRVPDTTALTGGDSTLELDDSGNVVVRDSGGGILFQQPLADIDELIVNGLDNIDDTLVIDFSQGNPIPSGGLTFHGGSGGIDTLELFDSDTDMDAETIRHALINENDGSVQFDFDGADGFDALITYDGLEPIIDNLNATNRIFNFTGSAETIVLSDDGDAGDGQSMIDSTLGESIIFTNPTNSLTVGTTLTAGADTINVEGLDSTFAADLSIVAEPGGGGDDTVNFQTVATSTGGGNIDVSAYDINVNAALQSGGGDLQLMANNDIISTAAGSITSTDGAVALTADADGDSDGTLNIAGNINHGAGGTTFSLSDADGMVDGVISGGGPITKDGTGTLSLAGNNTYGGGTDICDGTLTLTTFNRIPNGSAITIAPTGTFANGGHTETVGSIAGAGIISLSSGAALSAGGDGSSTEFSGQITGLGTLVNQGAGTLTLSGSQNDWSGGMNVASGRVLVTGALTHVSNGVNVINGAVLGGTGSIAGVINSGIGTIAPGLSPGRLTNGGQLQMNNNSTLAIELDGTTAGIQYDQFVASGVAAPSLGNAMLDVTLGFAPAPGTSFTVIDNQSGNPIIGIFAGLAEGATINVGGTMLEITYLGGTGNDVVLSTPAAPVIDSYYLSTTTSGRVGGVLYRNQDILRFDGLTNTWSIHFDGSDVGLRSADLDAIHINADNSILMSLRSPAFVAGLGRVESADIIRFIPTSLGDTTAGSFEMFLDGSDVGLTTSDENIDAISREPGGEIVISTLGSATVPGIVGTAQGEDLLTFTGTTGPNTAGVFSLYFDGSTEGLTEASENVTAAAVLASGEINLVTRGNFAVPGLTGDANDIFACLPGPTCSAFTQAFEGTSQGLVWKKIDGISIDVGNPLRAVAPGSGGVTERLTQTVVADAVNAAIDYWDRAGADVRGLDEVPIEVVDLPDTYLGLAFNDRVLIDTDAAGHGWFWEPALPANRFETGPRIDLLSAVTHELGHFLGHEHGSDVMQATLGVRQHRLPDGSRYEWHAASTVTNVIDDHTTDWGETVDQVFAESDPQVFAT